MINMAKIKLMATTKQGQIGYTLLNKELAMSLLAPLSGNIIITIETVDGDATDSQIYHFRNVIVPAFIAEAAKHGQDFTEQQAENTLLGKFACGIELEVLAENGKAALSNLIDTCKLWIREFFKTDII